MNSQNIQNKLSKIKLLETLKEVDSCEVSKASTEIMLERVCNGNEIDFPFSK